MEEWDITVNLSYLLLSYCLTIFKNLVLQVGVGVGVLVARLLVEELGFEEV